MRNAKWLWRLVDGLIAIGTMLSLLAFAQALSDVLGVSPMGRALVTLAAIGSYCVFVAVGMIRWSRRA